MSLVQIIPLGGAGEIGKNCTVVRQGDDIIVIDCGISFPHEEHFGVDIVIPDFTYLFENRDMVRAIICTHAHEDHVGALSFLLPEMDVPVYATKFTAAMIRSKLDERARHIDPDIRLMKPGDVVEAGSLSVEPIRVTHSIPETCAMAIRTSLGVVLFTADFKFDFTPVDGKLTDVARLAAVGKEGVIALVSDSTNIDRSGWSPSESEVSIGLRKAFTESPGRVLMTMFSSNVHRMQQALDVAKETGRKLAVAGRRMDSTLQLASNIKYVHIPEGTLIRLDQIGEYPDDEIVVLTTGSQGEPMAALSQMSRGEYGRMQIREGDTILYSARPIPGNEGAIWRTINRLFLQGANVVYESEIPIHVSGHGHLEEIKMMVSLTSPYYIVPVHGEPRHQYIFRQMAVEMGWPAERIFEIQNGQPLCFDDKTAYYEDKVAWGEHLIDQHGDVAVTDEVLSQRSALGHDGVVIVSVGVDLRRGEVTTRPEVVKKGFSGPDEVVDAGMEAVCEGLDELSQASKKDALVVQDVIEAAMRKAIQKGCRQRPVVVAMVVPERG
ncbi:MAG: ribonuclease J [Armatimonadetes bacterium]|nr:ribonuclease J [Armatimonadota bacterium]